MTSLLDTDNLINKEVIEDCLNTYYISTGINVFAIDASGNTLLSINEYTGFCNFFKDYLGETCPCTQSHLYASKQAEQIGEAYIFSCPAGLIHYTAPLTQDGIFKGAIIAGPILLDYPDEISIDSIIQKYNLSINMRGKISSYLKTITVVESPRVRYLSKLLFIVASSITSEDKYLMFERKYRMKQQSEISGSIHHVKEDENCSNYPYEMEKELQTKVKNGDIIGAKTILNQILGHIFFTSGGKMEVIKARTLELCTLLSRAAVEGGAELEKMFGMNYSFINELSAIEEIEELSFWILKVLDKFTENVFNFADVKNIDVIKKALNFVNQNYMKDITLDSAANAVNLNSSYFSTLFKKQTGIGFSDYLNKVRIQESKHLLQSTDYSILEIALEVGFEDQSYYSKVFKKITGMKPKEYRDKQG